MSAEQVSAPHGFLRGASNSKWYKNLKRRGSCLTLLALLREDRSLIHKLGPEDITVLHKGVHHGCVALVKFVLVDMFDAQGHCNCSLEHDGECVSVTREELLRKTSSYGSTAVNIAVVSGSPKMVLLLEWAIEMSRRMSDKSTIKKSSQKYSFNNSREFVEITTDLSCGSESEEEEFQTGNLTSAFEASQTQISEDPLPVPDVKDDEILILESSACMDGELIGIIEKVLEDVDVQLMNEVGKIYQSDVDYEFVPIAHGILHCLHGQKRSYHYSIYSFRTYLLQSVLVKCIRALDDGENGDGGALLKTLFNLLDPRGRTLWHAAVEGVGRYGLLEIFKGQLVHVSPSIKAECVNARDGAGRTILHHSCIHRLDTIEYLARTNLLSCLDWNAILWTPQAGSLGVLRKWCMPSHGILLHHEFIATQLVVLFDSWSSLSRFWPKDGDIKPSFRGIWRMSFGPLQLTAAFGRITILEHFLEHHTKWKSLCDPGLGDKQSSTRFEIGAIHCAAYFGQVEALQSILKFPVYDPIIQQEAYGTALHLLLSRECDDLSFKHYQNIFLLHLLPNSWIYKELQKDLDKLRSVESDVPRNFSANEISCINLLLQAGIDIWTPHVRSKALPSPGPMFNDEARKWWYEKVVHEVVTVKTSVTNAANATSVVVALVATASFIGPLQPPLGYGESAYVQTDETPVRVYFVCNSLSFFFSIASILMAILPAIPMPKESLYDELLRSQRCLKGAALMLLVGIICLLISFSSASLAVVSPEWCDRQLVVACVIFGGVICVVVLVVYIIRLLRMLFHKTDWFRRKFAKYMWF